MSCRITKLYYKELKSIMMPCVLLIVLYLLFLVRFLYLDISTTADAYDYVRGTVRHFIELPYLMKYGTVFLLSVILAYSFYIEWMNKTTHQLLTLPVPRYTVMCCKYLSALSFGIVLLLVTTLFSYVFELKMLSALPERHHIANQCIFAWSGFSYISWLLGIICVVAGILYAVKRNRTITGIFSFTFLFVCSVKSVSTFEKWVTESYNMNEKYIIEGFGTFKNEYITLINSSYLFVLGLLFFFAGLYIFEKYSDS